MLAPAYQTIEEALHHARTPFPTQQQIHKFKQYKNIRSQCPPQPKGMLSQIGPPSTELSMEKQQQQQNNNNNNNNKTKTKQMESKCNPSTIVMQVAHPQWYHRHMDEQTTPPQQI